MSNFSFLASFFLLLFVTNGQITLIALQRKEYPAPAYDIPIVFETGNSVTPYIGMESYSISGDSLSLTK